MHGDDSNVYQSCSKMMKEVAKHGFNEKMPSMLYRLVSSGFRQTQVSNTVSLLQPYSLKYIGLQFGFLFVGTVPVLSRDFPFEARVVLTLFPLSLGGIPAGDLGGTCFGYANRNWPHILHRIHCGYSSHTSVSWCSVSLSKRAIELQPENQVYHEAVSFIYP